MTTVEGIVATLKDIKGNRSYAEMAEQAGIPETTLWRIMNEERTPHAGTLVKLLTAFPALRGVFLPVDLPDGEPALQDGDNGGAG